MRPVLKYCGNHSLSDVKITAASRADYLGFIFTRKSKRTVRADQVAEWLKRTEAKGKKLVGVFADDSVERIEKVLQTVPLQVIQLHGAEQPPYVERVRSKTGRTVWKALRHGKNTLEAMRRYAGIVDGYIIDTKVKGAIGGTGVSFDWDSVPGYMAESARLHTPCLIAGGISPDNIDKLLSRHPIGIDIASGIETNFQKDGRLIRKIEERVERQNDQTTAD
ncbi:phosphoribosylanthranilate isomerase [Sporolactobacillus sp. CQH2019]|uniref:phosphoribosylanthranilate isomerase n=1 Tax=Sporolactobacillus sp. CQH2019 TaxID=3023512 RepID=UPI00236822CD|nr:phosphoribosylanthranilate isomerase [Sporolactobacillus sp. CQH2019]MDD9148664.1 phosphoribosylanthranilate isomerase [Sporolactobacillus sp. CQH2019]